MVTFLLVLAGVLYWAFSMFIFGVAVASWYAGRKSTPSALNFPIADQTPNGLPTMEELMAMEELDEDGDPIAGL